MTIMRSSLYLPANNEEFVKKSPKYMADIITYDVEDAVPPQEKRTPVKSLLKT